MLRFLLTPLRYIDCSLLYSFADFPTLLLAHKFICLLAWFFIRLPIPRITCFLCGSFTYPKACSPVYSLGYSLARVAICLFACLLAYLPTARLFTRSLDRFHIPELTPFLIRLLILLFTSQGSERSAED